MQDFGSHFLNAHNNDFGSSPYWFDLFFSQDTYLMLTEYREIYKIMSELMKIVEIEPFRTNKSLKIFRGEHFFG